jgi:thioredoxin reductase
MFKFPNSVTLDQKPLDGDYFRVLVDRGSSHSTGRFVVATATGHSAAHGEWFWGHYFSSLSDAQIHFRGQKPTR